MTAAIRPLPRPDAVTLRCPHCRALTEVRGGPSFATPLGVRRHRSCTACRRPFTTIEAAMGHYYDAALPVPHDAPPWALRLCAWIVRAACWVGRRRA